MEAENQWDGARLRYERVPPLEKVTNVWLCLSAREENVEITILSEL